MKNLLVIVLLVLAVPCLANGQAQPPKPGPEVQRFGYFVGTWKVDSETGTDPKRKYGATMVCEWFPGGFSVVCRSEGAGTQGPTNALYIVSYNTVDKAYTLYGIDRTSPAPRAADKMTVEGNAWVSESETTVGGKPAKVKHVIVELSPSAWSHKIELSVDGGPWTPVTDLKGAKVK
jgi:hypothetical protein